MVPSRGLNPDGKRHPSPVVCTSFMLLSQVRVTMTTLSMQKGRSPATGQLLPVCFWRQGPMVMRSNLALRLAGTKDRMDTCTDAQALLATRLIRFKRKPSVAIEGHCKDGRHMKLS